MKGLVSLLVLGLVAGCAGIGTPVVGNNNQIAFPHYSIVVPPDKGWHLRQPNERMEVAVLTQELGPPVSATFLMQFIKNDIFNERVRSWSARQVADDYRDLERRTMIEQGVNRGQYQLSDVVLGEETVGDKRFYTMKYSISAKTYKQSASMYLYFPQEANNPYFMVVHYSETMPPGVHTTASSHPEFLETLESLRVNQ